MKVHFTLLFTFACVTSTFAQAPFDYMLFRPGVQYLYDAPLTSGSHIESPILGMKLTEIAEDGFAEAYLSLNSCADCVNDICQVIGPSFAGREIFQSGGRIIMSMDSARTELVTLETRSSVGTTWAFNPSITGRVDSVRTETFMSLTDEVKYISFSRTDDGTPVGTSIRISKNHGLLTGTFFWKLETTDAQIELLEH